jgi:hypothetical protein
METWISHSVLTPLERSAIRRVLYEQQIHYPTVYEDEIASFMEEQGIHNLSGKFGASLLQKNGQLMGSVLSFPILCIANLLCYWNTLRIYQWLLENSLQSLAGSSPTGAFALYLDELKIFDTLSPADALLRFETSLLRTFAERCPIDYNPTRLQDLPVLVNGDDILFRSNSLFNAIWENYGYTLAGFQKSVGKNYLSRSYLTINSECFHVTQNVVKKPPHSGSYVFILLL